RSHLMGILLQFFVLDDFENRLADCAHDGISTERVEMNFAGERGGDLRRGDNGGERSAIANAFSHRDDVRNDTLRFKSPEMRAGSAEASLHFIGNADAACRANVFVSVLEIISRKF